VPAILKFGSAYNMQEHVASELKTASANATTRNLSLIVYDLAALAAQADVPFDRATRLAVRRACVPAAKAAGADDEQEEDIADDGDNDGDDEAVWRRQ
jgi:hypothetical protein